MLHASRKEKFKAGVFEKSATAVAAFTIVPRFVLGGKGFLAPSDQLTKGIIGVGSMGRNHISYAGTRVVAICDVDLSHLQLASKRLNNGAKTFHDYRELIQLPLLLQGTDER